MSNLIDNSNLCINIMEYLNITSIVNLRRAMGKQTLPNYKVKYINKLKQNRRIKKKLNAVIKNNLQIYKWYDSLFKFDEVFPVYRDVWTEPTYYIGYLGEGKYLPRLKYLNPLPLEYMTLNGYAKNTYFCVRVRTQIKDNKKTYFYVLYSNHGNSTQYNPIPNLKTNIFNM